MDNQTPSSKKGYRYHLTDEDILKYMDWPISTRLTWLEEANRFLSMALSPEAKQIRTALRKGEI